MNIATSVALGAASIDKVNEKKSAHRTTLRTLSDRRSDQSFALPFAIGAEWFIKERVVFPHAIGFICGCGADVLREKLREGHLCHTACDGQYGEQTARALRGVQVVHAALEKQDVPCRCTPFCASVARHCEQRQFLDHFESES